MTLEGCLAKYVARRILHRRHCKEAIR